MTKAEINDQLIKFNNKQLVAGRSTKENARNEFDKTKLSDRFGLKCLKALNRNDIKESTRETCKNGWLTTQLIVNSWCLDFLDHLKKQYTGDGGNPLKRKSQEH